MKIENKEKLITTKELAQMLSVSVDTVQNSVKKLAENNRQVFCSIKRNKQGGYLFTETQATAIKLELQNHSKVNAQTPKTELEVIGNAIQAFNALQDLYNQKEIEYKKVIAEQKKVIDTIEGGKGCYSMNQTAKALKLPYGNITLYKVLRELNILNEDNTPKQNQIKNGNFKVVVKHINDKIGNKIVTLTTSKGIVYLAKKFNTEIDKSVKADF